MFIFLRRIFFGFLFIIMLYGAMTQFYQGTNVKAIINTPKNQAINKNNTDKIYVAVIDTGFDPNHPAYKDKLSTKYRYSTDKSNDIRELPEYNNGYFGGGYTLTHHGTHIVGILCGQLGKRQDNSYSFEGVAPHVVPILIQLFPYSSAEEITQAFEYVKNTPAQIVSISMSFGQESSSQSISKPASKPVPNYIAASIISLTRAGKIVLLSAGNTGQYLENQSYTLSLLDLMQYTQGRLILVGATDHTYSWLIPNKLANFSARPYHKEAGKYFICAPGVNIRSSITHPFFDTQLLSGTSMATPIIAGALAHIMLIYPDPNEAIEQLFTHARKVGVQFGQGIVDLSFLHHIKTQ